MSTYWREWLKGRAMAAERGPRVVADDACPLGEPVMSSDGSLERLADDVSALRESRDKHGERIGDIKEKLAILEDRLRQRQDHWHDTAGALQGLLLSEAERKGELKGVSTQIAGLDLDLRRIDGEWKAADGRATAEHDGLQERIGRVRSDVEARLEARASALELKIEAAKDETKKLERAGWMMLLKIAGVALMGSGGGAAIVMKVMGGG